MGERLIENEVKLWLPRDLNKVKIKDDDENKRTDLVIATITGLTVSSSVKEKIKSFVGGVNGLVPIDSSRYYALQYDVVGVKIPNKEVRIKLFQGESLYYGFSKIFRPRLYYTDLNCSCLVELDSEELKKASQGRSVIVLMNCFNLLRLIKSGGNIIDGWLAGKYMIKDYGTRCNGFRINFTSYVSDSPSVLIGEKLQSGKFIKNDDLVPGNLYSFSRRITSEYFIYLGKIGKNILITKSWYNKNTYEIYDIVGGSSCWQPYTKLIQPSELPSELYCFVRVPNYHILNVIRTKGKEIVRGKPTGDLLAISQDKGIKIAEYLRGIELMKTELVPDTFNFCDEAMALIARNVTNNTSLNMSDLDKAAVGQIISLFPDVIWDTPELKEEFIKSSAEMCNVHWNTQQKLDDLCDKYNNHEIIGKHVTGTEVKDKFKELFPNEGIV
jgi:hypothetical protein